MDGDSDVLARVLAGETRAIARLMSWVEGRPSDVAELMADIHRHAGRAHTIGLTGVPGSGKSTLVHSMAKALRKSGRTVGIAEMTMAELVPPAHDSSVAAASRDADPHDPDRAPVRDRAAGGAIDTADFLARVDALNARGFHVLISEFFRHFRLRQYLARHTRAPVAFATDAAKFADIFREDFYDGLDGGILEGLGLLFPPGTTLYVYPARDGTRFDAIPVADHLRPLIAYLRERGQLVPLEDVAGG